MWTHESQTGEAKSLFTRPCFSVFADGRYGTSNAQHFVPTNSLPSSKLTSLSPKQPAGSAAANMGVLEYLPHLLYSTALTSIAMHHLYQRKAAADERSHVAAQISILEDLRTRLSAREPIPEREIEQLWHLARSHDVWVARAEAEAAARAGDTASTGANVKSVHMQARPGEEIGWREVLLGRRFDSRRTEELDRKDLESVAREVQASAGGESR
ncbi:hypothetical protein V8D89_001072 [Ganoderma adspersum]